MDQYPGHYCKFADEQGQEVSNRVVFVEVKNPGSGFKAGPQIIDKRPSRDKYRRIPLNESQAFILRLALQGIPMDHLTDLYLSEYDMGSMNREQVTAKIEAFIEALVKKKILLRVKKIKKNHVDFDVPADPSVPLDSEPFNEPLVIDFGVDLNQTGTLYYKIPPR